MDTEARLKQLQADLILLQKQLGDQTRAKFKRINPFVEDLTDWKERGAYWLGEDKNVTIYNSTTLVGDVSIGENTWIGPYCSLDGTAGLSIGKNCSISLGCQILTHDTAKWALSGGKMPYEYGPTKIGDNCFLGSYVVVLKGITIGNHCLVGAGAVVTHDVPDFSVVLGVPGKVAGKVKLDSEGLVTIEIF
jgi:acetyltransferase-like isoleucine patch superfamily enzyme